MPSSDSPIRLLHFADVHFGVENYGRNDPATGLSSRLIDFRVALLAGIREALADDVEIAVFAGDAYRARDPSQTHQREFAACLRELTIAGVPVVLLTGNHDIPHAQGKANAIEIYDKLGANNVTVLDRRTVTVVETKRKRPLQIAAIPYLTKSLVLAREEKAEMGLQDMGMAVAAKYEQAIASAAAQCALRPELPTVLTGHFTATTAQIGQTQAGYLIGEPQVPLEALRRPEFDYVALGHIHKFQDLNRGAQPPIVYCGSVERIDFGERAEEKGVVIADVARGHTEYRFVQTPTRPFLEIEIDATKNPTTDPADPTDYILSVLAKHDLSRAIVKLMYKVRPEDLPLVRDRDIRQALQAAFMVVSHRREVAGSDKAARVRSKLLKESLMPLDALATYLDSNEHLARRKEKLMAGARLLWDEIIAEETSKS